MWFFMPARSFTLHSAAMLTAGASVISMAPVSAQVVTSDETLSTTVNWEQSTDFFTVTGGLSQGSNLFHSFETFSPADGSVLFDLTGESFAGEIERIFSRVTGGTISEINGSLSILGGNTPDLFLLNPNGIVFGANARLNLPGSFVGTTAESIDFADGFRFGAIAPQSTTPLLSISVPKGLQFGQNPGAITVLGNGHQISNTSIFSPTLQDPAVPASGLSITPGQTLALLGGAIQFEGAELQPLYQTLSTGDAVPLGEIQLEVGAVATGSVQLNEQAWGWSFDYSGIEAYGDIAFTNRSWLNAGGLTPGRINLSGRNISLDKGSAISINNFLGLPGSNPSGITIRASELLKVEGDPSGSSLIRTTTTVQEPSPNAQSQAGLLDIWSKNLQILDGAYVDSSTFGIGEGAPLSITVQENLKLDGQTDPNRPISNRTAIAGLALASGDAGDVTVKSENLLLTNGGSIVSASIGPGDGGRVDIDVREQVTVQEFNPLAQLVSTIASASTRDGNSGEGVFLKAKRLDVLNGGDISSSAFGSGDAGEVQLDVSDAIRVGGFDSATSTQFAAIDAGVILDSVSANAFAEGNGTFGKVGSVTIRSATLDVFDGGQISVTNEGGADAGDLNIQTNSLTLSDQAEIIAKTQAGDGGSLKLMANESILLRRGSEISASSQQQGSGGNILIKTPNLIAIPQENSDITANATGDSGGTITINASSVLGLSAQAQLTSQSDITASSERGTQFSGSIELSQPAADPTAGIMALPSSLSPQDVTPIANACSSDIAHLARRGRGGLPLGPNNLLHDRLRVEGENEPINQAIALRDQGFYAQAQALLLDEVESSKTLAESERLAIAFRQLGITYKLLEQHKESRAALEQSLALSQGLNQPEQTSATLLSLGNLTRAKDKVEEARGYYQQALAQNPDRTLKHQILANQLSLEAAVGEPAIVQRLAKVLLDELAGEIRDSQHLETRLNVAATLLKYRQLDLAPGLLTFLEQDLEGAKRMQDPGAIAYGLGHLSKFYDQTGQWGLAQEFAQAALNHAQMHQDQFQEYRWAWQLGRVTRSIWEASGDEIWRAQSKAAYKISLQALQHLREDLATVSPALQFSFRQRVEPVYRQYVGLLLAADSRSKTSPSSSELEQALKTIEALRLAELDNFFKDACLEATPQSIESLDPNAAVLYPIVLDDRMAVILSHKGKLQHHSIPISPQALEATTQAFQQGLVTRSRRSYKQPGEQLYDWLIRPVLAELEAAEIETLVFVPDGPLAKVPMAALSDGEQYLMEQFNVAIAPSLQLLPAQTAQTLKSKALVAGISKANQGLNSLAYVEQEVESIEAQLPTQSLINEAFTQASLEQALLETQTPIVHIATHGQFSSKAADTFIAAWDERINIEQLHQLLSSRDRNQLSPTELLILSACETAIGDDAAALGLAGVAVRAGARSTLASLWSINDQSTAQLMEEFYQQLAQPGLTKSAALREAQLAMLEHPIYQHPYYWSAFVLMGSWQ